METTRSSATQRSEDLTPTPTQAENDAAMIAATGGEAAPAPPVREAERKPEAPARTTTR